MTTVRYSRYVVVNENTGSIVWHECRLNADKDQKYNGGTIYDYETDDPVTIENALRSTRRRMGLE